MVDYDPATGQKGRTLRALASYRRRNGHIVFGILLRAMATTNRNNNSTNKAIHREDVDSNDNGNDNTKQDGFQNDTIWIREGDTLECR
mmetsp:Transcript_15120/g.32490  ORF Transcript_15120/g.32490 Transcript_15120/m.32490 type:complete len:88 (-) Transcript_15120:962-1225(-)